MYGSETISILGPKIWDILPTKFKKKNVPPTLFKKKFRELAQKNCHVIYAKRRYKTLDFCKLSISTYLFCSMWFAMHIKESTEAVIDSEPYTP